MRNTHFEYRDALDNNHGPFRLPRSHPLQGLIPLYKRRELRKYHSIRLNHTIQTNLVLWKPSWRHPDVDCLWLMKIFSCYSYVNHRMRLLTRTLIQYVCWVICIIHSVHTHTAFWLGNDTNIYPYYFSYRYICCQYIVTLIISLICRRIVNLYSNKTEVNDYPSALESRYVTKTRSIYQNMGIKTERSLQTQHRSICGLSAHLMIGIWHSMLLVIGSGNILNVEAYKYWFYQVLYVPIRDRNIMYKICIVPILCLFTFLIQVIYVSYFHFLVFVGINIKYDPLINNALWVIPDRYDIQNDITYFVLRPLFNHIEYIRNDAQLKNGIYHIVNIVTANVLENILRVPNKEQFCEQYGIKWCSEIQREHVWCMEQYLRRRFSVVHTSYIHTESKYDEQICECHEFDNSDICWKEYELFKQIRSTNYLCFVIPIMLASYIAKWVLFSDMNGFDRNIIDWICWDYGTCLMLLGLLFVLYIEPIYNQRIGFKTGTKDMIFWMNYELLYYCKIGFNRRIEERIVAYMVRLSARCIQKYVYLVTANDIYMAEFMHDRHGLSVDVIQIIIDYLCDYECVISCIRNINDVANCVDGDREDNQKFYNYNIADLNQEVGQMINRLSKCNIIRKEHRMNLCQTDDNIEETNTMNVEIEMQNVTKGKNKGKNNILSTALLYIDIVGTNRI